MKLLILSILLTTSWAAPAAQSLELQDDGSYRFYYETGREGGSHSRSEARSPDGVVIGRFSYEDPDGQIREVNYRADDSGFVAEGDVSVQGAPKGQFPAVQDEEQQGETSQPSITETTEQPAEPKALELKAEDTHVDIPVEEDKDGMQDLTFEESSSNDPPEAFPPGFFLEKFQGLRRLPEPTNEDKPSTTESPKEPDQSEDSVAKEETKNSDESSSEEKSVGESNLFAPLRPFPVFAPQEWAASMFHQPVYVFSYRQPDSYGYHYFY